MMTDCKASRLIPSTVTQDNTTAPTPLKFYYWSRSRIPSRENINMQGKVTSTEHCGSFLHFHKGPFSIVSMGMNYFTKRQTQTLDKLILVLAIIYTHHNILFFSFSRHSFTYFSSLSVLLHCCATKNPTFYNLQLCMQVQLFPYFSFMSFDERAAKTHRKSHSH